MCVLMTSRFSRESGRCEREQRTTAGLHGGKPLQAVTRAKTEFGQMEGKGECGAAFTPAANLAIGSLLFSKTLDENTSA